MAVFVPGKLLYLAHHGVGSWSTTAALRELGGQYVDVGLDRQSLGASHHAPFDVVIRHCDYQGEPVVCTVRDPYEVWVTEWTKNAKNRTFIEYLTTLHDNRVPFPRWQTTTRRLFWHVERSNIVMRHERLEADWDALLARCGLRRLPLPRVNLTKGRPAEAHTKETVEFINRIYGDEIRELGYPLRTG